MKKGNRHYDKPKKELWWFIQEYLCEILVTIASLVCLYFIGKALIYGIRENQMQKLSGDISTQK